jgi:hypothetical protein
MGEHDRVELVAVQDEQLAAVRGLVDCFAADFDAAEIQAGELAEHLVVIAGDIDDPRTALGALQHPPHHIVVRGGPVKAPLHAPAVDDVADQIHGFAVGMVEKVDQHLRVAAARAQMDVGNPDRAKASPLRHGRFGMNRLRFMK